VEHRYYPIALSVVLPINYIIIYNKYQELKTFYQKFT
jgi:hypothetical protein